MKHTGSTAATRAICILFCLSCLLPRAGRAQDAPIDWTIDSFRWSGSLSPASRVEVLNPYGGVRVRVADGGEVEVSAMIQRRASEPATAKVVVEPRGDRLKVEVIYPAALKTDLRRVDLTLFIPAAAPYKVSSLDGTTESSGVSGDSSDEATAKVPSGPGDPQPRTITLRGAEALEPSTPTVFKGDLRDLPRVSDWAPGDGIKEVPRRHHRLPRIDPPAPKPQIDPLLGVQARAPQGIRSLEPPMLNFAGQGFTGVNPPDTVGDVGIDHYIQAINSAGGVVFTIYDKDDGSVAAGPIALDTLGTGNCASGRGDPIVLFDQLAGRWFLSEFSNSGNRLCIYISVTGDPIAGGWYAYQFTAPTFPDYPKYGVWPDAYYVSANEDSPSVYALNRTQMLAGGAATAQRFTAPSLAAFGFQALIPGDADGDNPPPAGAPNPFMRHRDDEAHNSGANDPTRDFLEIWEFHVDFASPASSTFTGPINIPIAEIDSELCGYTSFSCFAQPGSSPLDPLREVIMHRLQYRNFGSHQTLVGNLVTDVDGTNHGGIRWFELRKTGGGWAVHQEGTYAPDIHHRWMGSAAMDGAGNLAVGYSAGSTTLHPSIRYTGRSPGDPLGTLQGEITVIAGSASNSSIRWGDYAAVTVDPVDDRTFWLTTMYSPASAWATRIAKFRLCDPPTPPGSVNATATVANRIDLSWTDSSPAALGFDVYRAEGTCAAPGAFVKIASNVPGFTYQDTTVSGNVTYAYRLTGRTADCASEPSGCAQATATGACTVAPIFAGLQTVTNPGTSSCSLNLAWSAAAPRCGPGVTYNIYRGTAGFVPGPANRIATGVSGTAYQDPGPLNNGQSNEYIVRAVDPVNGLEDGNTVRVSGVPTGPFLTSTLTETFEGAQSGGGFDNAGWSHSALAGATDWVWSTAQAKSPTHSWFSDSLSSVSARVLVSPEFGAGAGTTLSFWHTHQFESACYDGGTLEISTNGGTSWTVLPDAAFTAGGFTGTINTGYSNPLAGKRAWCSGTIGPMTQVTANLSAYAGQKARLRWQEGDDASLQEIGWSVDSVTLSSVVTSSVCTPAAAQPLDFYTLTPCRLVDTRLTGPALQPASQRTFVLSGACGVPSTAKALTVNLTATQAAALGYLTLYPADLPSTPVVSTLNFKAADTRSGNGILRLATNGTGQVIVYNAAAGTVHLILDVTGYFE
jgi:hypothetical protein